MLSALCWALHFLIDMLNVFMRWVVKLSVVMLSIAFPYCYVEWIHVEGHYGECCYAELHVSLLLCWIYSWGGSLWWMLLCWASHFLIFMLNVFMWKVIMVSTIMLSIAFSYYYAECLIAKCHYAECCCAEHCIFSLLCCIFSCWVSLC
jgi:hypothetical protein